MDFYDIKSIKNKNIDNQVHINIFLKKTSNWSTKPEQLIPSPVKAGLQVQVNEPCVLVHVALLWQLLVDEFTHSSKSETKFDSLIQAYYKDILEMVGEWAWKQIHFNHLFVWVVE